MPELLLELFELLELLLELDELDEPLFEELEELLFEELLFEEPEELLFEVPDEPLPDLLDEPVPAVLAELDVLLPDELLVTDACVEPGSTAITAPAATTEAKETVMVVAFRRRLPCSRSATARAIWRAAA